MGKIAPAAQRPCVSGKSGRGGQNHQTSAERPPLGPESLKVWAHRPESLTGNARTACPDDFTGSGAYHPGALTGYHPGALTGRGVGLLVANDII